MTSQVGTVAASRSAARVGCTHSRGAWFARLSLSDALHGTWVVLLEQGGRAADARGDPR